VADAFLEQIRAGHAGQAWESTSAEFKSAEGRETFVGRVKQHPWIMKPMNFEAILPVSLQNSVRSEYVYRATTGPGKVRLLVANERGAWRIDRMVVE
jgi:hypothetical protein